MELDLITQYQSLEEKILALNENQLSSRLDENNWSVAQILDHLAKVEAGMAKAVGSNKGEAVEVDSHVSTEKLKTLSLNREMKLKAPAFSQPEKEVLPVKTSLQQILANRQFLADAIKSGKVDWLRSAPPHPFLGPLGKKDWYAFIYFHMERHVDQIDEILEKAAD